MAISFLLRWLPMVLITVPPTAFGQSIDDWRTDWSKSSIELSELKSGGVPRDGIPSIDSPKFVSMDEASTWLSSGDPVVLVEIDGEARIYPLQILTFHEIVNDEYAERNLSVTFCPLCYSAIVFDREVSGQLLDFGVSGLLRNSDLVMYDRQTESLWQQFTGEAIVGSMTGKKLDWIPSQIISFAEAMVAFPNAQVLSRDTGHLRSYGNNPYVNYDAPNGKPYFDVTGEAPMPPMTKVVGIKLGKKSRAYPYPLTRSQGVVHDVVSKMPLVIFHTETGATSALDKSSIADSRDEGSVGVFDSRTDGASLTFSRKGNVFVDDQTNSVWDVTGRAISGHYEGTKLVPVVHGTYFAFAWFAFQPKSDRYND